MTTALGINIGISLFLIFTLIIVLWKVKSEKEWGFIVVLIILVHVMIGYGILGTRQVQYQKQVKIDNAIISKNNKYIIVDVNGELTKFESHTDYIIINDSAEFYYDVEYNMYNDIISKQLKYK